MVKKASLFKEVTCPVCSKKNIRVRADNTIFCSRCEFDGDPYQEGIIRVGAVVRCWERGNSTGIVLPVHICDEVGIEIDSLLSLDVSPDKSTITIKKCGYRAGSHRRKPIAYSEPPASRPVEVHISGTKPGSTELFREPVPVPVPVPEPVPALGFFQRLFKKLHL